MNEPTTHDKTRRELFRSILRYLALGGLAVGGAFLLSRTDRISACSADGDCPACPISGRCPIEAK